MQVQPHDQAWKSPGDRVRVGGFSEAGSFDPRARYSVVLSNPPFGRKSSLTMVGVDGRESREEREIERQDFIVTTSNKQLNFLQHIATILDIFGRAAVVLPDKVTAPVDVPTP